MISETISYSLWIYMDILRICITLFPYTVPMNNNVKMLQCLICNCIEWNYLMIFIPFFSHSGAGLWLVFICRSAPSDVHRSSDVVMLTIFFFYIFYFFFTTARAMIFIFVLKHFSKRELLIVKFMPLLPPRAFLVGPNEQKGPQL